MTRRAAVARAVSAGALSLVVAACGGAAPAAGPSVDLKAVEYAFAPATITVAAGRVTFRVTNAGTTEHEFEIVQGGTAIGEVEGLVPGLTGTLTVDLKPGAYTFQCLIAAHDKLGMTGTLTVK